MTPYRLKKLAPTLGPLADQARKAHKRARAEGWDGMIRTVNDLRAAAEGYYFEKSAADRVQTFFEQVLRLSDRHDARKTVPFNLVDWQRDDVIRPLFGWMRPNGTRRFRRGQVWVPKKNGKTELASGINLYMLTGDNEPDPEVYSAAISREQAGLVYKAMRRMCTKMHPQLRRELETVDYNKRILYPNANGFYAVLPNRPGAVDGISPHCLIFDELHRQKSRELFDSLTYSGISRPQPLFLIISTAGDDLTGIGAEQFELAKKIVDGDVYDPETFAYVAAADPKDDWTKPKTWRKANPSMGITFDEEQIASDCARAQQNPSEATNFKRLRLNLWVGKGEAFVPMSVWKSITEPVSGVDLEGLPAYGGLDLSSNVDLTSFTLRFRDGPASRVLNWNWIPHDTLREREKTDGVPYGRWVDEGHVIVTNGDHIDLDQIRHDINGLADRYDVQEIAFDPRFASQIAIQLGNDGFEVFRFRQSAGMMTPVLAELDRLVRARLLYHGGHPVLQWAASNLEVVTTTDGLMKPVKVRTGSKIDPMIALIMSLGPDIKAGDDDGPSVYSSYDDPEDGEEADPDNDTQDAPEPARPGRRGVSVYEGY